MRNSIANHTNQKPSFNPFCFSKHKKFRIATINGNYASVKEQSGLISGAEPPIQLSPASGRKGERENQSSDSAGDGGFQVNVKGNTALKGGVIESSAKATEDNKNTLSTATLTSSNIQNQSEYSAQSISAGTGGAGMPMALKAGDSTSSTTRSGISGAAIKITDDKKQTQLTGKDGKETVATLNKNVTTGKDTSGAIDNNLDVTQVQTAMTVTQTFVQQANTYVADQAQKSERLKAAGEQKQKEANAATDPAVKEQLQAQATDLQKQSADTKAESDKWGAGGTYGRIATALTAAAGGNVTGSTTQLIQGAAVNYIQSLGAEQVKHIADTLKNSDGTDNPTSAAVRSALHGIVACAGGSAQGSDCGSSALGVVADADLTHLPGFH